MWVQAVVIKQCYDEFFLLDDGTGLLMTNMKEFSGEFRVGDYLCVRGIISINECAIFFEAEHVNRLSDPNTETLWILEVIYRNSQITTIHY